MLPVSVSRPAIVAGAIALVLLGAAASRSGAQSSGATSPVAPDIMASLVGAPWRIVEVAGMRAPADARISFSSTSIVGSAGCNRFHAPLVAGSAPRVGPINSTLMFCKDRMESERAVFDALRRMRTAARAGDTLELRDETGAAVLKLSR